MFKYLEGTEREKGKGKEGGGGGRGRRGGGRVGIWEGKG